MHFTAGVAQSFTVTAKDAFGNVANGYQGTVSFGGSDAQAGLPASYTFTAADAGVHTFSATLKTAGSQSITVKDTASPTVAGSQSGITVTAAALSRFALSISTTPLVGKSFTVTVAAVDAFGNPILGYRGKVHFPDSAANANLPSDYTFSNTDNGVHTFTVTLNTAGTQTLTVFDTSNGSITGSATVTVSSKTSGRRPLTRTVIRDGQKDPEGRGGAQHGRPASTATTRREVSGSNPGTTAIRRPSPDQPSPARPRTTSTPGPAGPAARWGWTDEPDREGRGVGAGSSRTRPIPRTGLRRS